MVTKNEGTLILITPNQASSILGVTEDTLSIWRCTGRYNLPYVKIGRKVRYRESDLIAFIESRMRNHTSEEG